MKKYLNDNIAHWQIIDNRDETKIVLKISQWKKLIWFPSVVILHFNTS